MDLFDCKKNTRLKIGICATTTPNIFKYITIYILKISLNLRPF